MKINTNIKYEEKYLPTKRHRILRTRIVEEPIVVELREVRREDAPVAMVATEYQSYLDENGKDQFGLRDTSYLAVAGELYSEKRDMSGALDRGAYSMEEFSHDLTRAGDCYFCWDGKSRGDVLRSLNAFIDSHILIDGTLYEQCNEPRYVVMTFGLGHNHGGTSLSITQRYNPNISKERYFSALQREEAIAYANKVAENRGDTNYIGKFGKDGETIQVFMPEMVRCNPQLEHGEGDPFLNSLEGLVQGSDSVMEAGLLVISAATAERSGNVKPSLADQIQSASSRSSAKPDTSHNQDKTVEPSR